MGLEAATYISQLVATNPVGATDPVSQGDDHIRLLKQTIQNTFPNLNGAVTASPAELNQLDGGQITSLGAGSASAPPYSFAGDTNTGIRAAAADDMRLVAGGADVFRVGSGFTVSMGQHYIQDGSAAAPSLVFDNDTNTGIYRFGADQIGFTTNGALKALLTTTTFGLNTGMQFIAPDGSSSAPAFSFGNDLNTGFYRSGSDAIDISTGGSNSYRFTTTQFISGGGVSIFSNGAVGAPTYSFASDTNTGMYRGGEDNISLAAGGVNVFNADTGNIHLGNVSGYILDLGAIGTSSSAVAGSATALPALPAGYAVMALTGSLKKFPYYNFS